MTRLEQRIIELPTDPRLSSPEFFDQRRYSTLRSIPQSEGVRTTQWKYIRWLAWDTPVDNSTSASHE